MLIITLDYGYTVRIDRYNHTLMKKQIQHHRNGLPGSVVTQAVGYYPDLKSCIDQYIQECQLFILTEDIHSIKEYAEFVQKCNEDTADHIISHIEEYCRRNQK